MSDRDAELFEIFQNQIDLGKDQGTDDETDSGGDSTEESKQEEKKEKEEGQHGETGSSEEGEEPQDPSPDGEDGETEGQEGKPSADPSAVVSGLASGEQSGKISPAPSPSPDKSEQQDSPAGQPVHSSRRQEASSSDWTEPYITLSRSSVALVLVAVIGLITASYFIGGNQPEENSPGGTVSGTMDEFQDGNEGEENADEETLQEAQEEGMSSSDLGGEDDPGETVGNETLHYTFQIVFYDGEESEQVVRDRYEAIRDRLSPEVDFMTFYYREETDAWPIVVGVYESRENAEDERDDLRRLLDQRDLEGLHTDIVEISERVAEQIRESG